MDDVLIILFMVVVFVIIFLIVKWIAHVIFGWSLIPIAAIVIHQLV